MTMLSDEAVEVVAEGILDSLIDGILDAGGVIEYRVQNFTPNIARAAITTYHQHLASKGFAIVPVEPTKEMILAGEDAYSDFEDSGRDTNGGYDFVRPGHEPAVYKAMISASAPKEKVNE